MQNEIGVTIDAGAPCACNTWPQPPFFQVNVRNDTSRKDGESDMSPSQGSHSGPEGFERELESPRLMLPAVMHRNEEKVRKGFWKKLLKVAGRVPFAEEAAAAYYCVRDPATPLRVKAILLAALAYFVTPTDLIPDFVAGFGFTDDATVLMAAMGLVSSHVTASHRRHAREALHLPPRGEPEQS